MNLIQTAFYTIRTCEDFLFSIMSYYAEFFYIGIFSFIYSFIRYHSFSIETAIKFNLLLKKQMSAVYICSYNNPNGKPNIALFDYIYNIIKKRQRCWMVGVWDATTNVA
jgi:hypothetical protein